MKSYSSIPHYHKGLFGEKMIAFEKLDGSNFRAEWSKKSGFYKFGTRNRLLDKNDETFGSAIDIFLNKYSEDLTKIFKDKYSKVDNFVVFGEFFGPNSFAGEHLKDDSKDVILFDVDQYKRGVISPYEFLDNFGHLHIPKTIEEGIYTKEFVNKIQNSLELQEGVVCKGILKNKNVWMCKVKTYSWLLKIREKFGEEYVLNELNNDQNLIGEIHHNFHKQTGIIDILHKPYIQMYTKNDFSKIEIGKEISIENYAGRVLAKSHEDNPRKSIVLSTVKWGNVQIYFDKN